MVKHFLSTTDLSREETEALVEEGIAVLPLPIPKALKETLQ